jgi:hypothetical protein
MMDSELGGGGATAAAEVMLPESFSVNCSLLLISNVSPHLIMMEFILDIFSDHLRFERRQAGACPPSKR